jgi:hypothetical protein
MQLIDPGVASATPASPQATPARNAPKPVTMPLTFRGDIHLADLKQLLNVTVPPQLVAKFIPDRDIKKEFVNWFPSGIPVVMRGTTSDPKVDVGNIAAKIGEGLAKSKLQKVIPGLTGTDQKQDGKKNDIGGAIGDILGGGKSNPPPDTASPPDNSSQPPKKKKK